MLLGLEASSTAERRRARGRSASFCSQYCAVWSGGLKLSERIFLGLALLHRYRNKRQGTHFEHLYDLLAPEKQKEAEVLGKAMRFGAMLMVGEGQEIGRIRWQPRKRFLHVELPAESADLFGEVAQSRLMSLVNALDAEVRVTVEGKRGDLLADL